MELEELIRRKGLDEAAAERDRRKRAILAEVNLDPEQFRVLVDRLHLVDAEFREACTTVLSGAVRGSLPAEGKSSPEGMNTSEWVLENLRAAGGSVWGPDLYDRGESEGKNRRAIQTTVSALIAARRVQKGKWEKRGLKRRGSWLHLVSE